MKRVFYFIAATLLIAPAVLAQETPAEKAADSAQTIPPVVKAAELQIELELGSGITERMPTGMADSFGADVGKVFAWCRVTGATDTTFVRHVYYYRGEEMGAVDLPVRSPSWRTWSSKNILPEWVGDWEVRIFDESGGLLASKSFKITVMVPEETTPETPESGQPTGQ